ncbi:MAG: hypothetical protein E7Z90_04790 [Cyanobacteria bacterium SIG29]|nr:hypothetical protein [Cyanobacteria bacterium SIG29]
MNNYALTSNENLNHYIVFELQNKYYAINIQNVIEVINIPQIEIPQMTPEGIIGIFNYNGIMIKVVDLCPLLGFTPDEFSINNQLIIVNNNDTYYAIHTNKIINISQSNLSQIQELPYNTENSILKSIYKADTTTINIIDVNQIEKILDNNTNTGKINYAELFPKDEKSKQILNIRAEENKKFTESFSFPIEFNSQNQYILFQLNNQNYYLDIKYVKEFISVKRLNITKLPYTQDFIRGIINLKGDFLVVLDLKKFLNDNTTNNEEGKLIIVESNNFDLALLVDEIKYIKNLKNIKFQEQNQNNNSYILTEFMEENELYSILNFEKIINDERIYINIK